MKIVLIGYGEMFRAVAKGILSTGHDLVGVFRHDNIVRGKFKKYLYDIIFPHYDYLFVKNHKLHDICASSVNSKEFKREIKKLQADVIIVTSWSEKFSKETIELPSIACVNLHPSLLPKYRGPNPYMQVILHQESKSGITFHLMNENFDEGDIIHQAEINVLPNETGNSLKLKSCSCAKREVQILLNNFILKLKMVKKQDSTKASYFKNIELSDSILDFEKETAIEIDKKIRAFNPWLSCHIPYKDEFFTFSKHSIQDKKYDIAPATIINKTDNELEIICKDGNSIKFSNLKIKRPFCKMYTSFYINHVIKINSKAV